MPLQVSLQLGGPFIRIPNPPGFPSSSGDVHFAAPPPPGVRRSLRDYDDKYHGQGAAGATSDVVRAPSVTNQRSLDSISQEANT
jgi:hypothetical protein